MKPRSYVPELDGLRAIAALAVMGVHARHAIDGARWATVAARWARSGWLGVDLFFVLSGYLLTRGLYDLREGPHYYRRFYGRRVLRIMPLYYAYLAGIVLVASRWTLPPNLDARQEGDAALYAIYLGNVVLAHHSPGVAFAQLWSLAVEEHFYALWPATFRRLSAFGVVRAAVVVALLAMVARWVSPQRGRDRPAVGRRSPLDRTSPRRNREHFPSRRERRGGGESPDVPGGQSSRASTATRSVSPSASGRRSTVNPARRFASSTRLRSASTTGNTRSLCCITHLRTRRAGRSRCRPRAR